MKENYKKFIDKVIVIKGTRTGVIFLGETGNLYTLFYGDYPNDIKPGEIGEIYYTWHKTGGSDKYFRLENQPENIIDLFDKYIAKVKSNNFNTK